MRKNEGKTRKNAENTIIIEKTRSKNRKNAHKKHTKTEKTLRKNLGKRAKKQN